MITEITQEVNANHKVNCELRELLSNNFSVIREIRSHKS